MVGRNPWYSLACRCIFPIFVSFFMWSSTLCVSFTVSKFLSFYKNTSHIKFPSSYKDSTLIQYDLILTWLHPQRLYLQINLHPQVYGIKTWTCLFGERQFNPEQHLKAHSISVEGVTNLKESNDIVLISRHRRKKNENSMDIFCVFLIHT